VAVPGHFVTAIDFMKIPTRFWVGAVSIAGVLFYVVETHVSASHSEGYKFLEQAIRAAPNIRGRVGDVTSVELSWTREYRYKTVGDNEWVWMNFNVKGSKGSGTVAASAQRLDGVWSIAEASMDGHPIALH
jgi:hypothetical protein